MEAARHIAYAGGWKKLEPFWDLVIRAKHISRLRPTLEAVLTGFGRHATVPNAKEDPSAIPPPGTAGVPPAANSVFG